MPKFALQQVETKYRTGITQAQGYLTTRGCVWSLKTLVPDYLAPKQFSKMPESSDDFACTCVSVEFRFHLVIPIVCGCAFVFTLVLALALVSLLKTRL